MHQPFVNLLHSAAFEPHSALPLAMPGVFCQYSDLLPPGLKDIKVLASSSVSPGSDPKSRSTSSFASGHNSQ